LNQIDLKGRTAIVTGAARGFGLAITERFLDSGAAVSMWDMDGAELQKQAKRLAGRGKVETRVVDVTDEDGTAAAAKQAHEALGRLDILVNNAGIMGAIKRSWEYSLAEWHKVMAVNVDGVYLASRAVVPYMLAQQYGRIVNLASIAGKNGSPYFNPYSTSKAAVIGLTKSMGKDLARSGVIVNCITPAAADTNILDGVDPALVKAMVDQVPMERFVEVTELAAMVAWMSSEECSFTSGAVFDITGGRSVY
jgi:2-dehydro-3-deoxy-L-rhamnonate dehydrogenase (NAD+)